MRFIDNLIKRGHESPLEFGHVTFRLITSRDVLAELTRHRLASFCVESQRYVNENTDDEGIRFIRPLFYTDDNASSLPSRVWKHAMEDAESDYNLMILYGVKNQDARKVLPNSTACTIVMDVNLRELRHIYNLRSSPAAYPEMRELMRLLKIEVDKVLPGFLPDEEGKT